MTLLNSETITALRDDAKELEDSIIDTLGDGDNLELEEAIKKIREAGHWLRDLEARLIAHEELVGRGGDVLS